MRKVNPVKTTRQLPTRGALNDLFNRPTQPTANINDFSKASPLTPDSPLTASIQNLSNPRRQNG